jgi:transposase
VVFLSVYAIIIAHLIEWRQESGSLVTQRTEWRCAGFGRALRAFARRQPGCRALTEQLYGIGAVTATAILAELGDARRFRSSDDAVRHSGLDVTVWQSDRKRAAGHLSHQGPSVLRWALFEAAQCAARRSSPDHAYYLDVAKRIDHNRNGPASFF